MNDTMLKVAIEAVREACLLCSSVQSTIPPSISKSDRSPVTIADFGAQAVVGYLLEQSFPEIPLVGEEDAQVLRSNPELLEKTLAVVQARLPELNSKQLLASIDRGSHAGGASGRFWTLDPIDGTKGFLRGDQYAIALALIDHGEVVMGVLGCPNLPHTLSEPDGPCGSIFAANLGGGTFEIHLASDTVKPAVVERGRKPAQRRLCESVERAHTSQSHSALVAAKLGLNAPPTRIDSQCKYAAVARGDAEMYLRLPTKPGYVEKIWDHAAGFRIILEAGGEVSDVHGRPLDFSKGRGLSSNLGVVVSNGFEHDKLVSVIQRVMGLS